MGIMGGIPFEKDYEEVISRYELKDIAGQTVLDKIIHMQNNLNNISLGQIKSNDPCLTVLVEQNWMIIKLLDSINKKLDK